MIVLCPQCGKDGEFGWLGKPDKDGVSAMVRHYAGMKTSLNRLTGREESHAVYDRHWLSLDQLQNLEWFKQWKAENERIAVAQSAFQEREWELASWDEVREKNNDDHA